MELARLSASGNGATRSQRTKSAPERASPNLLRHETRKPPHRARLRVARLRRAAFISTLVADVSLGKHKGPRPAFEIRHDHDTLCCAAAGAKYPRPQKSALKIARREPLSRRPNYATFALSRVPRAGHEQVAKEISDASEPVRRRTFAGEAFAR
jgi:hypothetical protein